VRDLAGVTLREVDACAWDPRQTRRSLAVLRAVASCVTIEPISPPGESSATVAAAVVAILATLAHVFWLLLLLTVPLLLLLRLVLRHQPSRCRKRPCHFFEAIFFLAKVKRSCSGRHFGDPAEQDDASAARLKASCLREIPPARPSHPPAPAAVSDEASETAVVAPAPSGSEDHRQRVTEAAAVAAHMLSAGCTEKTKRPQRPGPKDGKEAAGRGGEESEAEGVGMPALAESPWFR